MPGRDRISELPEHLRTEILSYLPTKDSVKTSVLATGWKSLWLNVPGLDLNCSDFPTEEDEVILSFVDKFLEFNSEARLSKVKKVVYLKEGEVYELIDVPRCFLSTLECVEIKTIHEWEEEEMKVASYFLKNAALLILSLTDYPRYVSDSEITEELKKSLKTFTKMSDYP